MFGWYGGQPFSHFVALNGQTIVSQSLVTAPIPEPSAYALALAGLGVLGVCARRRRKA
ncbi:MAG: PEP-CTERM sorting domain-containing protein [Rubrivivax sp.]|nr:PEP-CTERM sorting domain-containing protein [Rubrivivax sp.]